MATKKYISLTRLSDFLDNIKAKYSQIGHSHTISDITDYTVDTELSSTSKNPVQNKIIDAEFEAVATSMGALESAIDSKANSAHIHSIDDVANLQSSLDEKVSTNTTINGKALTGNITLSASDVGAATSSHSHDDRYYTETEINTKLAGKADVSHTHDDIYYTETEIDTKLAEKSDVSHTHDDMYYTESEIDTKLAEKSDTTHNHDGAYDAKGSADTALESAKTYTNDAVADLVSATTVDNKISTHNTSTTAHNDIRVLINDLAIQVNNFLDVDDTTTDQLSEVLTLINDNKGDLESLTTSKVNVSDIIDNLTTASATKVLSANQGVAIKKLVDDLQTAVNGKASSTHTHAISDVTNLQSTLDAKQETITGAATTIASSDLTASRAVISNASGKVAVSDVTSTELGYLSGATSNIQTQLNAKAASSALSNYYTKTEIDEMEFITVDDIDTICGGTIEVASLSNEVSF